MRYLFIAMLLVLTIGCSTAQRKGLPISKQETTISQDHDDGKRGIGNFISSIGEVLLSWL